MSRSFLILHGVNGSALGHWQTYLAQRLRQRGEVVFYPELSGSEQPDRDVWLRELRENLLAVPDMGRLTVVCHSLACILWLHHISRGEVLPVERLILVAPPGPSIVREFRPTFDPVPMDAASLHASATSLLLVATNGDPRCPENAAECYGRVLGVDTALLPDDAAHINTASGFGDWQDMSALCLAAGISKNMIRPRVSAEAPARDPHEARG